MAAPARTVGRWLAAIALAGVLAAGGPGSAAPAADTSPAAGNQVASMAMGGLDKLLAKVDATDEQKGRIRTILLGAAPQIAAAAAKMRGLSERFRTILTAPTVDRAALEQFRASIVTDIDQVSRAAFQAIGDAADVLRPEQRAKLATSTDATRP